jgi:assimilatory nitrate reductase catalytic subunit
MVLTARGAEQQSHGTDNVLAYINLLLALGRAGKKHSGYGCLTGQGNGQGGREHGQKSDQLPGYRKLTDEVARAHVAGVWGVDPKTLPQPGLSACDMFKQFGTGVRGLLVFASNILVSSPDAEALSGGLGSLDLLVVADMFLSETAARADVVLPVAQWAEEDGTMTNLEGRVIRRRKALSPPEGVWTDQQVLLALCRCGRPGNATAVPQPLRDRRWQGALSSDRISRQRRTAEQGFSLYADHRAAADPLPDRQPDPPCA